MAIESVDLSAGAERQPDRHHHIPLLETTVTAFIGRTERGPMNEPVALASYDDFRRVFGGHRPFTFLPYAVQHYFLHGGQAAVVVRVANRATRGYIEVPARGETLALQALQPGSRELLRVSIDYDGAQSDDCFNLVVQRLHRPGSGLIEDQELFLGLSMKVGDDRYVVDALRASKLVRLAGSLPSSRPDATRAVRPGQAIPYLYMTAPGCDGEELTDYDIVGSHEQRTGLFALERIERFDLLCLPPSPGRDVGATTFLAAARYCERRRAMLVWDVPWAWQSADTALLGMRHSVQRSSNALMTFPRVVVRGEIERFPDGLPASGAVAGMLARASRGGMWRALAGADAALKGGLRPLTEVDARASARLQRAGLNVLRRDDTGHYALHGNETLADGAFIEPIRRRLDRARLALFILGAVERAARRCAARAPEPETASAFARGVTAFLAALHEHGALAGGQPEQAYFVAAPSADDAAPVALRFGFALAAPGDFLAYELRDAPEGLTARAIPSAHVDEDALGWAG